MILMRLSGNNLFAFLFTLNFYTRTIQTAPINTKYSERIYKIDLNLNNCSYTEVFNPFMQLDTFLTGNRSDIEFELNGVGSHLFKINAYTGVIYLNNLKNFKLKPFYELRLAILNRKEKVPIENVNLFIRIENALTCAQQNLNNRIRFLFADSIFSYDLSDIMFNEKEQHQENVVYLKENTQVGSFICYILTFAQQPIQIKGVQGIEQKFLLEPIDFGSTSLLIPSPFDNQNDAAQVSPVISLYTLKLADNLDRELVDKYELEIGFANEINSQQANAQTSILKVHVTDVNDNQPKFEKLNYKFDLYENNHKNVCVGRVKADDPDLNESGHVIYSLIKESFRIYKNVDYQIDYASNEKKTQIDYMALVHMVRVDQRTGEVCLTQPIDRECVSKLSFMVKAQDKGKPVALSSFVHTYVEIEILDLNDNVPLFYDQTQDQCNFTYQSQPNSISSGLGVESTSANSNEQNETNSLYYLQEEQQPGTFIAWIKAYDLDENQNAQIDYELVIVNKEDSVDFKEPFYIDSNGIVRNRATLRILYNKSAFANESDSILWSKKTEFVVKIIAKDRGSPSLQSETQIQIRLVGKMEKHSLKIELEPNRTLFFLDKHDERIYEKKFLQINAKKAFLTALTNNSNEYLVEEAPAKLSFQLIPIENKKDLNETVKEYGQNCRQEEILKYFSLNRYGEIFISKRLSLSKPSQFETSENMICFVNIRVLDVTQSSQLSSSVELIFIINNDKNQKANSIHSDDLLKNELINRALKIKEDYAKMADSDENIVHQARDRNSNEQNPTSEFKNVLNFLLSQLNYMTIIGLIVLISGAVFVCFFAALRVAFRKRKPTHKDSAKTPNFLHNLDYILNLKAFSLNRIFLLFLRKVYAKMFGFSSRNDKNEPNSPMSSSKSSSNHSTTHSTKQNLLKRKKKFSFFKRKSQTEKELSVKSKDASGFQSNSLCTRKMDLKKVNDLVEQEKAKLEDEEEEKRRADILNGIYFFKNEEPAHTYLDLSSNKHKIDLNLFAQTDNGSNRSNSLMFASKTSSLVEDNREELDEQHDSSSPRGQKKSKKVYCGIYQVSNQIIIDYDDNPATCEIYSSKTNRNTLKNQCLIDHEPSPDRFASSSSVFEHKKYLVEPLQRFEKIYYEQRMQHNLLNNNMNHSSIPIIEYPEHLVDTKKFNLSSFV